jgi:hypothetical protein
MKKLLLSAAFVTLLASPAFAQSYDPNLGTGNIVPYTALGDFTGSAGNGYAYMPSHATMRRLRGIRDEAIAPTGSDSVYVNGQYRGRDPDPNVRLDLRRDDVMGD